MKSVYIFSVMLAAAIISVKAELSKEHQEKLMGVVADCQKESDVTEEELKKMMAKQLPETEDGKCFLACVFKKFGVMDDSGMLSEEKALELADKANLDDGSNVDKEKAKEHAKECIKVNSQPSDDKGCERAYLATKCMKDKKDQLTTN